MSAQGSAPRATLDLKVRVWGMGSNNQPFFQNAMAQNVSAEDYSKDAVGKGQGIDRSGTDWAGALGCCSSTSLLVRVETQQSAIGVPGC